MGLIVHTSDEESEGVGADPLVERTIQQQTYPAHDDIGRDGRPPGRKLHQPHALTHARMHTHTNTNTNTHKYTRERTHRVASPKAMIVGELSAPECHSGISRARAHTRAHRFIQGHTGRRAHKHPHHQIRNTPRRTGRVKMR